MIPSAHMVRNAISDPDLDAVITRGLENRTFPSIACGVWIDGKPVYRRIEGSGIQPETRFDAASLTKPLATTILALRAVEARALDLSRTLGYYLTDSHPELHPATAAIPVGSLLTHTSGLPPIPALHTWFPDARRLDRAAAIRHLCSIG
ncbi:MAG: beta-lactamase family protein, partial [Rectinema sp.]|nr:beta-lactamase family protein [Rectinema sp.]